MKYNYSIKILETLVDIVKNSIFIENNIEKNNIFKYSKNLKLNNNIYVQQENDNEKIDTNEINKSIPVKDNKAYNGNISNDALKNTSSNEHGVIDSITQELTSSKLQQAIILSKIVIKPRSKTRKRIIR